MLDIELVNEPLDIDSFTYLNDEDYPACVLGFQLKNLYDQKRLIINKKYNPRDIIHLVPNDAVMPKFFRGIDLTIKKEFLPLISHLEVIGTQNTTPVSVENYKNILKNYNLKCENCFAYLNKGIYPIDSECLSVISSTNLTQDELYSDVLEHNDFLFQTFGYFVIYILSNKNTYKTPTKNYLHAVVKKYNSV
jgi:hypothetical protein